VAYGVVERFLLYGDFDDDVFATGGDVEIRLEPRTLYDDVRIYPLAKLDRSAALYQIKKSIHEEEGRCVCVSSLFLYLQQPRPVEHLLQCILQASTGHGTSHGLQNGGLFTFTSKFALLTMVGMCISISVLTL